MHDTSYAVTSLFYNSAALSLVINSHLLPEMGEKHIIFENKVWKILSFQGLKVRESQGNFFSECMHTPCRSLVGVYKCDRTLHFPLPDTVMRQSNCSIAIPLGQLWVQTKNVCDK